MCEAIRSPKQTGGHLRRNWQGPFPDHIYHIYLDDLITWYQVGLVVLMSEIVRVLLSSAEFCHVVSFLGKILRYMR